MLAGKNVVFIANIVHVISVQEIQLRHNLAILQQVEDNYYIVIYVLRKNDFFEFWVIFSCSLLSFH